MEVTVPTNYLPQGKNVQHNGFGYVTNKNQYEWLNEHAIEVSRRDDFVRRADRKIYGNVSEQNKKIELNTEISDYYNRIMSRRIPKPFGFDPWTDESRHHTIYNLQI